MMTKNVQKSSTNFICEKCDYNTCRKSQYERHLQTKKHNNDKSVIKQVFLCKNCNKEYKYRQGLHTHKKTCKGLVKEEVKEKVDYKDLFIQMLNQNKELQELLITQQQEYKKEQKEIFNKFENLVLHIKPSNTINSNNKTINNKNNFNIMMFLNDKCKDAMTIQDFAERLVVTIEDLEKKKFDCLSNTILKNLKSLAITERPVHCGNIKRKEWYLNDKDNGWEMDNGEKLIKNTEYGINKKFQNEFKKIYPNYSTVENIQDKYVKLINRTFTDLPENEKSRLLNILSNDLTIDSESI
jgi:hypothetical protein